VSSDFFPNVLYWQCNLNEIDPPTQDTIFPVNDKGQVRTGSKSTTTGKIGPKLLNYDVPTYV
jgi:hypothetical protein